MTLSLTERLCRSTSFGTMSAIGSTCGHRSTARNVALRDLIEARCEDKRRQTENGIPSIFD